MAMRERKPVTLTPEQAAAVAGVLVLTPEEFEAKWNGMRPMAAREAGIPIAVKGSAACPNCTDGIHTPSGSGDPRPCPYCRREHYASSLPVKEGALSLGDIPISGDGLRFEEFEGSQHTRAVMEKVTLQATLHALVAKWRGRAEVRFHPCDEEGSLGQCADELEALLDG